MSTRVEVSFPAPLGAVFQYLADPRHRPEWQSTLRAVEMTDAGEPRVGMRWTDVTSVGMRPAMEITECTPERAWAETGHWRGLTADLRLTFAPEPGGTRVAADVAFSGRGAWGLIGAVVSRVASIALRQDLRSAAKIVAARS